MYLGPENFQISTVDKDLIREIYIKQFNNFTDREFLSPLQDCFPMQESLLQIGRHGPHQYGWKAIRSVVAPAFTTGKMKLMHPTIHERIQELVKILHQKCKLNDGNIEMYEEYQALTMDVIGRTAFGVDCDSLNDRNDLFYVQCRRFFNDFNIQKSWILVIGCKFLYSFLVLYKNLKFSVLFRPLGYLLRSFSSIYKAQTTIANNLRNIIKYRQENHNDYKRIDLIKLLLDEDEERQKRENKPPMHLDTIVSNCFAFMIAGYETTSTALIYASWLLAKHPDVQEKLYLEITDKLKDEPAEYDNTMKLPYLDAVFKETLRIKPPVVFFTGRTCVEDTVINGLHIPKRTNINVPVHVVHWNEDNWENPQEFNPERFTDGKTYDQLSWIPFGIGPRHCAGIRFAENEFKITLVEIIRNFKFELSDKSPDPLQSLISAALLRPFSDVYLKVIPR